MGNRAKICVTGRSWVAADAMQQREFLAPCASRPSDGFLHFTKTCHTCRHNHGLSRRSDVLYEPPINQFERCDLVGRRIQLLQKVNCAAIERRAEDGYTDVAALGEQ